MYGSDFALDFDHEDHLIVTEEFASNLAFSPDQKTIYVTADMLLLPVKLR